MAQRHNGTTASVAEGQAGLHGSTTLEVAFEFASFDIVALPVQHASGLQEAHPHSNSRFLTLPSH